MATVSPVSIPILQFFNNAGQPNAGGSVLTQVGGINYPTYQDSAGAVPLPNPIPLNGRGEISNSSGVSCQLFGVSGVVYTFTLYDSGGNQINQSTSIVSLCPSTSGTGILKGNNAGGTATATPGVDYVIPAGNVATATLAATATTALNLSGTPAFFAPITNSLAADVALNNTANFFTGPTVAQGSTGVWFTCGTITLRVNSVNAAFHVKLWDDTTLIAETFYTPDSSFTGNNQVPVSLSGFISAPAGNIRISVRDIATTTSLIQFGFSTTYTKQSTLTAFRIG